MSAPKRRIALTLQASRDLAQIMAFTERRWGRSQRRRYRTRIDDVLDELTSFPNLGQIQGAQSPGVRRQQVGEHTIYYSHDDETVTVLRILHRRMKPEDHLSTVESTEDVP